MSKAIRKIVDNDLCLGCGACEAIAGSENCEMKLAETGFYQPNFLKPIPRSVERTIRKSCPSITVNGNNSSEVWGVIQDIKETWSNDPAIRQVGSSGGSISAFAVHALQTKRVDAVLHVGLAEDTYLYNKLKVSRTREEIMENAASRYAPALVFDKIFEILDSSDETYLFIGKPCDVSGFQNILKTHPKYQGRIKYFVALFCAGMPSFLGTKKALSLAEKNEEPISLKYRGDGWPGYFKASYADGSSFKLTYNESWGKILGKTLGHRCKICPDGIGLFADLAVGDSWKSKDGYPDFEEADGRSFVIARTDAGMELLKSATEKEDITANDMDAEILKEIQPYQFKRRTVAGYRFIPTQIITLFPLRFKNLKLFKLMSKADRKFGMDNLKGTAHRLLKQKLKK